MKKILTNKKGFTLMEIIVVLIILAVLAAALIPSFVNFARDAGASSALAEARVGLTAAQAVLTERIASGPAFPATGDATLAAFLTAMPGNEKFQAYLLGDAPGTFSAFGMFGPDTAPSPTRIGKLTYVSQSGWTVTLNDGEATTVRN